VWMPLTAEARAAWNNTAAWAFINATIGANYGFQARSHLWPAQRRRDVRQTKRNHATDAMQPNSAFDPQEFATTFIDTEFDNLPWYSRLLVRACVRPGLRARQRRGAPAPVCVHLHRVCAGAYVRTPRPVPVFVRASVSVVCVRVAASEGGLLLRWVRRAWMARASTGRPARPESLEVVIAVLEGLLIHLPIKEVPSVGRRAPRVPLSIRIKLSRLRGTRRLPRFRRSPCIACTRAHGNLSPSTAARRGLATARYAAAVVRRRERRSSTCCSHKRSCSALASRPSAWVRAATAHHTARTRAHTHQRRAGAGYRVPDGRRAHAAVRGAWRGPTRSAQRGTALRYIA
jgi:hypothetical protein